MKNTNEVLANVVKHKLKYYKPITDFIQILSMDCWVSVKLFKIV